MCKPNHLFSLVIIVSFICLPATMAYSDYVCGDANSDGALNVSDAVFIINHIFIGGPAPNPNCCVCPPTVTDYDGNVYQTILIGDQCWMAQNLKVTHYRNGDAIPHVTDAGAWSDLSTGAYCEYDNNPKIVVVYGRLYNWLAVFDSRNIAPAGWHVPTDVEWQTLVDYLGGSSVAGGKLKEAGTTHWAPPNTGATNESGFSGLPGGYRYYNGSFDGMGLNAYFWSSTECDYLTAWLRILSYSGSQVNRYNYVKWCGCSVRCVRD